MAEIKLNIELAGFISGDGVEHVVQVGSAAFDHMAKDGSFRRVNRDGTDYEPAEAVEQPKGRVLGAGGSNAEPKPVDLTKLDRTGLIAEAAKHGIEIDAEDKAQTKKVIIERIETRLGEAAAADAEEDDETNDA